MPCLSQKSRTPFKNPGGGTTYPPSPWMGSIMTAAVSSADVSCAGQRQQKKQAQGVGWAGKEVHVFDGGQNAYSLVYILNRKIRGATTSTTLHPVGELYNERQGGCIGQEGSRGEYAVSNHIPTSSLYTRSTTRTYPFSCIPRVSRSKKKHKKTQQLRSNKRKNQIPKTITPPPPLCARTKRRRQQQKTTMVRHEPTTTN